MAFRSSLFAFSASVFVAAVLLWHTAAPAQDPAPINIVTTSCDLASLAKEIGGEFVRVKTLTRASQNLHGVEATADLLPPLNDADLLIEKGMALENGWLEKLVRNTSNRQIQAGGAGRLDTSIGISKKLGDLISIEENDEVKGLHPDGNPHYLLDPRRAVEIADVIREKITQIRPELEEQLMTRFDNFDEEVRAFRRIQEIRFRALPPERRRLASYGHTWAYFADWLDLTIQEILEPAPGVSPLVRPKDTIQQELRNANVNLVLMANYQPRESIQNVIQMSGASLLPLRVQPNFLSGESYIEHMRSLSKVVHERLSSGR